MARNSRGEMLSISALIKTQGSDTKLVGQMQPYYEAKTLSRQNVGALSVPPLVSQIGDGENGGVMMNEFPDAFRRAWYDAKEHGGGSSGVVGLNGTEYLELIEAAGYKPDIYPACQPVGHHLIWQRIPPANTDPSAIDAAIEALGRENTNLRMEGASWTNDRSWVRGYERVLDPMRQLSALFHEKIDPLLKEASPSADPASAEKVTRQFRYHNALLHDLLLESSDFRYWGAGRWTDYAREIFRRGQAILTHDF
jgi:hypothetical protein